MWISPLKLRKSGFRLPGYFQNKSLRFLSAEWNQENIEIISSKLHIRTGQESPVCSEAKLVVHGEVIEVRGQQNSEEVPTSLHVMKINIILSPSLIQLN